MGALAGGGRETIVPRYAPGADMKHWHVYIAGKRDRRTGPARAYLTDGLGFWSRTDANWAASGAERDAMVRQCELPDCRMKERCEPGERLALKRAIITTGWRA